MPVEWTVDGWLRALGATLDQPLPKLRGGAASPSGQAPSDDFSHGPPGLQWCLHAPGPN